MNAPRNLTRATISFGAVLRRADLSVTTGALIDAVRALEHIDIGQRNELYLALRTLLVSRHEEQRAFDTCFAAFWRLDTDRLLPPEPPEANLDSARQEASAEGDLAGSQARLESSNDEALEPEEADPVELPGQSELDLLMDQDFATFPSDQLDALERLTVRIARQLATRPTRRRKPTRHGGVVDVRRSMRANVMRSDIVDLRRRVRRRRKLRLVLLCDISGSMNRYSRFLVQFLYALQNVFRRIETFTFATRLTRISDLLRTRSYKTALARLAAVRDWSGGTRIGESLQAFNEEWYRLLDRHTVVLVLSDGWDTGDPDVLVRELTTIKRRSGRIIWLNPLLGDKSYEPLARGMAAALPIVDHFGAAHNLASLRALASRLSMK